MKKNEMIGKIAEDAGCTKAVAARALDSAIACIRGSIENEGRCAVAGLGVFTVKETAPRTCVNPRTHEKIEVPAGKRVRFSLASSLKAAVAGKE